MVRLKRPTHYFKMMTAFRENTINGQKPEFGNPDHINYIKQWSEKQQFQSLEKEEETPAMLSMIGTAVTEDHWIVECPTCDRQTEYTGFFDSAETYKCNRCQTRFTVSRIKFTDGDFIK